MTRKLFSLSFFFGLMLVLAGPSFAQRVELSEGTRAAGLWVFPVVGQTDQWVYIPAEARIAQDANGGPQFSFLRFTRVDDTSDAEATSITEADGGAILNFLIEYHTPADQIATAEAELQQNLESDSLKIKGPMVFQSGRYTLVSSILNDKGQREDIALMNGAAPVLEGNKLALSFELDKERSAMLIESFQMATPDISLVFDLEFSGLTDAYDAQVLVDWDKMHKSNAFEASGSYLWFSADIGVEFERLTQNASIDMTSSGESASMEALTARIYEKLLEILFEPIKPERADEVQKANLLKSLGGMAKDAISGKGDAPLTPWSGHMGYERKEMRIEGRTVLDFNHREAVNRHAFVTSNIGDLFSRHGQDERYFRVAQLDCSVFCQRNIAVSLDGDLTADFGEMVNNVTVSMRKVHENGEVTLREITVSPQNASSFNDFQVAYGLNGDTDKDQWMFYDFRTRWNFKGGGTFESDWTTTDEAMIVIYAPYQRQSVQVVDAGADLKGRGVRAVLVGISYPFFGRTRSEQKIIRVGDTSTVQFDITLPENVFSYDYSLTWMMENGDRPNLKKSDNTGLVFLDPPPGAGP
jgi:hypothetical protein